MIKIMFICHGNICRSPMAEFILRDMSSKAHIDDKVLIASSATSREEIWGDVGNPVYPPAVAELEKHGIFCGGKRAVQLTREDYEKYDLLVVMDEKNMRNALWILGADPDKKLFKLMSFTERGGDVADPWYSNRFDVAYKDIYDGCLGLMELIKDILKK